MKKIFRWFFLLLFLSTLTGCFTWMRVYQVYLQLDDFEENFSISSNDEFSLNFKDPILYSDDFVSLSKLQPSEIEKYDTGKRWRYWFKKVDENNNIIQPEIKFYFDLEFDLENKLSQWTFSSLFLQIAPPEFLEVSLRSIGGAEINASDRKIKIDADNELIKNISRELPKKSKIISYLKQPLSVLDEVHQEIYHYHFLLDTPSVEEGYEERVLSVIKLSFDKQSEELTRMTGRFAGLKISVNYKKYLDQIKRSKMVSRNQHNLAHFDTN